MLAVTFLAMNYLGIGLHKISLGSLIIALGLLVDDVIILPALRSIEARWPAGYQIQVAGAVEESSKGSSSIAADVPIMLCITFTPCGRRRPPCWP